MFGRKYTSPLAKKLSSSTRSIEVKQIRNILLTTWAKSKILSLRYLSQSAKNTSSSLIKTTQMIQALQKQQKQRIGKELPRRTADEKIKENQGRSCGKTRHPGRPPAHLAAKVSCLETVKKRCLESKSSTRIEIMTLDMIVPSTKAKNLST